jgi:hypothetical protein
MPILYGAVAYREDEIPRFDAEISSWELQSVYKHPIACPKADGCDKIYRLVLEVNASDETAREFVDIVLRTMEREPCVAHSPRIRINAP